MSPVALSILTERRQLQEIARQQRASHPKVRMDLRISAWAADALDNAAAAAGMGLDQYVERMAGERGL